MSRATRELVSRPVFAGLAIFLPLLASAHPDRFIAHDDWAHDGWAGLLHPLTGIDHLLAMFAVGLWAVRLGRNAMWTLPVVFPLAMVIGGLLALAGIGLPAIEPMIAVSVVVLGVMIAAGIRLPIPASALLVGTFAVFHGYAHVIEAPSAGKLASYAMGFVSATVMLHALGLGVGALAARHERLGVTRLGGSAIAVIGVAAFFY